MKMASHLNRYCSSTHMPQDCTEINNYTQLFGKSEYVTVTQAAIKYLTLKSKMISV